MKGRKRLGQHTPSGQAVVPHVGYPKRIVEPKAAADRKAIQKSPARAIPEAGGWSRNRALLTLAAVTVGLAVMSEVLTGALEPASKNLGLTPLFTGVFMLALVGNAAELFSAVRFARNDQPDVALEITVGASIQVALVVRAIASSKGLT